MEIEIRKAELTDIELLIKWRMQVLHEVFSIAKEQPLTQLEYENRIYYKEALPSGDHIACLAYINEEIIGCGGICLYKEMPSPDNPCLLYTSSESQLASLLVKVPRNFLFRIAFLRLPPLSRKVRPSTFLCAPHRGRCV